MSGFFCCFIFIRQISSIFFNLINNLFSASYVLVTKIFSRFKHNFKAKFRLSSRQIKLNKPIYLRLRQLTF
jgi:hypothetical protein